MSEQYYPSEGEFDNDGKVVSAEDWLGNRFRVGDLVMYCISAGRGQMMAVGKVVAMRVLAGQETMSVLNDKYVPDNSNYNMDSNGNKRWVFIERPKHERQIEVQVLTERTSGRWGNERRSRPAWVNPMNITSVNGFESALK